MDLCFRNFGINKDHEIVNSVLELLNPTTSKNPKGYRVVIICVQLHCFQGLGQLYFFSYI